MNAEFSNISILGSGLLGGSLALALAAQKHAPRVKLWARKAQTASEARALGIDGATDDLKLAVEGVDLLVLCVPVGAMPALVTSALEAGLPATCLVTDVGSVKQAPHRELAPLLAAKGIEFIGSHPMAGSERNGLAATSATLFEGAACLLTHDGENASPRAMALEAFWQSVGCHTAWMTPAAHDALVARISHLPHLIAASASRVCLKNPADGRFGGGGLRDTTRVASGNPEMWAEILTENRAALLDPLRESIADLQAVVQLLEKSDQQAILQWLAEAKQPRDSLSSAKADKNSPLPAG
jgi:prephenate dehydrogenase